MFLLGLSNRGVTMTCKRHQDEESFLGVEFKEKKNIKKHKFANLTILTVWLIR